MQSPESSVDWHDHSLVLIWMCRWVRLNLVHVAPLAEPGADLAQVEGRERERERHRDAVSGHSFDGTQKDGSCLRNFVVVGNGHIWHKNKDGVWAIAPFFLSHPPDSEMPGMPATILSQMRSLGSQPSCHCLKQRDASTHTAMDVRRSP